jgi:hypothetical protein
MMESFFYSVGIFLFFYSVFGEKSIPIYYMFYPIILYILLTQLNIIKDGKKKNTKS